MARMRLPFSVVVSQILTPYWLSSQDRPGFFSRRRHSFVAGHWKNNFIWQIDVAIVGFNIAMLLEE
jgi:hypothetical protein